MMKLAPIILFVFNRPWHTEQTLDALMANELAKDSILYIFADGPKLTESTEEIEKIKEVRNIIKQKKWCKEVYITEERNNKGLANSIIDGVTEIVNKHNKIIVLEDDLVTGKGFLNYMNDGLNLYENEEKVCSIHAYNYPINTKGLPNTFFLKGADCWGWGTWKRGWDLFNNNGNELYQEIIRNKLGNEFNFNGAINYTLMLKNQLEGKTNSWAICWYASTFLNNRLTLYPKVALVKNIGLDGSGTHCENDKELSKNMQNYCVLNPIDIIENKEVIKRIKEYFKPSIFNKIINKIQNLEY